MISVELYPDIATRARKNLIRRPVTNVRVLTGDGTKGCPEAAPYDAVLVSAAYPEVPPPLITQLREGGRLVHPIGPGGNDQVTLFERSADVLRQLRVLTKPTSFACAASTASPARLAGRRMSDLATLNTARPGSHLRREAGRDGSEAHR